MSNRQIQWTVVLVVLALIGVPLIVSAPVFRSAIRLVFPEYQPVHVLFGGDMMFDRTIRREAVKRGGDFLFTCLDPLLSKADLVVANLEGPITSNDSVSLGSEPGDENNFTFTFPTSTAALLARHNIGLVNLGNNHIDNFGRAGIESTSKAILDAGGGYFGDPIGNTIVHQDLHGVPIAYIGYNAFIKPYSATSSHSLTLSQIRMEREAGNLPVVYTHWGEEYRPATVQEKDLAHEFIDAGAEIVIGSHPHVVQEHEVYKGKHIYYSLGNLIFDQYWNADVSHGLMLDVAFTPAGVLGVKGLPVELGRNRQTCPVGAIE